VIDLSTESTLSLSQAARLVPPGRGGARASLSCILRWVLKGAKSPTGELVRLDAVRLGGRWITSREALQRFAERLTPRIEDCCVSRTQHTPTQRQRANERVAAELARVGI
jgi:hypothetical protein